MIDWLLYVEYSIWGLMGALGHLVVMRFVWDDKVYPLREILFSLVVAFVISQTNMPNSMITMGLAFMGVDVMEAFLRKVLGRLVDDVCR